MKRTGTNIQHKTAYFLFDMLLPEQSYLDERYQNPVKNSAYLKL